MSAAATLAALAIVNVRARRWPGSAEGHFRGMADRSSDVVWSTVDLPATAPHLPQPGLREPHGADGGRPATRDPRSSPDIFGPRADAAGDRHDIVERLPVTCTDGHVVILQVTRTIVPGGAEGRARDVTAETGSP